MAKSSKVQDVSLSDLMECAVCLSQVNDHRALPCQHLFCKTCLEPLVQDGKVPCPVCRQPCHLSNKGVAGLPKNPLVVNILESLCATCKAKPREEFCPHCERHLCSDCSSACRDAASSKMADIGEKSKKLVAGGRLNMSTIIQILACCQKEAMDICRQIDTNADAVIQSIRAQQKALKEQVLVEAGKESQRLTNLSNDINNGLESLEEFIAKCNNPGERKPDLSDVWGQCNQFEDTYLTTERLSEEIISTKIEYTKGDDITMKLGRIRTYRHEHSFSDQAVGGGIFGEASRCSQTSEKYKLKQTSAGATCKQAVRNKKQTSIDYKSKGKPKKVFGGTGSGPGELGAPSHVTVCPVTDNIIVCDPTNSRINIYNKDGRFVTCFGSTGNKASEFAFGGLVHGGGIAVSPDGTIIVSDTNNHRLQTFTGQGQFIRVIGCHGNKEGQFSYPRGVTCDDSGNIYVVDSNNQRVQAFTPQGGILRVFDKQQGWGPVDIAVLHNGDCIVTNWHGSIELFNAHGQYMRSYKSDVVPDLNRPCCVAVDTEGNIIVSENVTYKIHVLSVTGQHICSWDCTERMKPVGVACTRDGGVVVVGRQSGQIYIY